jgi:NifU-like protein involved in Fe-S cluster formation
MKYNATITDHFESPRNMGELASANAVGEAENAVCLDRVRIYLLIDEGVVRQASFLAEGCVPTIAAASVLTGHVAGMSVADANGVTPEQIEALLGGIPATKRHAGHVAVEALREALARVQ